MKVIKGVAVHIILATIALLSACASSPPVWTPPKLPEQVLVPVAAKCPAPVVPAEPTLPIASLKAGDSADRVRKAYAETIVVLEAYAKQLEDILAGYKSPEQ
jgi:hypothetical protein